MIREVTSKRLMVEGTNKDGAPFNYVFGGSTKLFSLSDAYFTVTGLGKDPVAMTKATLSPLTISKYQIIKFLVEGEGPDGSKLAHIMGDPIEISPPKKTRLILEGLGERGALVSLAMERPLKITAVILRLPMIGLVSGDIKDLVRPMSKMTFNPALLKKIFGL